MNIEECKTIYEAACKAGACKGNIDEAKEYLDFDNAEGFERVCRGNWQFLQDNGIEYSLTNGMREYWHANGQLCERYVYANNVGNDRDDCWHYQWGRFKTTLTEPLCDVDFLNFGTSPGKYI